MGLPFFGPIQPEITLNLPEIRLGKGKGTLEEIMEEATDCFKELIRFNSPYYLFIDELDVYRGQRDEYLRDLRMVRDLIREVKFLNRLMQTAGWNNTKLFCTIRPEVIHAIDRVLSGNIGRQVTGFDCPLTWFRNTRETYTQPIMHLLMRRIELAEEKNGERIGSEEERYKRWFPQGGGGRGAVGHFPAHHLVQTQGYRAFSDLRGKPLRRSEGLFGDGFSGGEKGLFLRKPGGSENGIAGAVHGRRGRGPVRLPAGAARLHHFGGSGTADRIHEMQTGQRLRASASVGRSVPRGRHRTEEREHSALAA